MLKLIPQQMLFTLYCPATLFIARNGGGTHIRDLYQLQKLTTWVIVSELACTCSHPISVISNTPPVRVTSDPTLPYLLAVQHGHLQLTTSQTYSP
jgi:hypothetical protein